MHCFHHFANLRKLNRKKGNDKENIKKTEIRYPNCNSSFQKINIYFFAYSNFN